MFWQFEAKISKFWGQLCESTDMVGLLSEVNCMYKHGYEVLYVIRDHGHLSELAHKNNIHIIIVFTIIFPWKI